MTSSVPIELQYNKCGDPVNKSCSTVEYYVIVISPTWTRFTFEIAESHVFLQKLFSSDNAQRTF